MEAFFLSRENILPHKTVFSLFFDIVTRIDKGIHKDIVFHIHRSFVILLGTVLVIKCAVRSLYVNDRSRGDARVLRCGNAGYRLDGF